MITNHSSKYKVLPTVSTNILNSCVIHTTDYDERKSICQNGLLFFFYNSLLSPTPSFK